MNTPNRIKVALLTTDAREGWRDYDKPAPYFFTPQEALLQGIAAFPHVEMHVISCWQRPMAAPEKLGPNIWFHGLPVPKIGWLRTAYQGCVRAVRKKLRELQPDIVHGQGTERDCALSAVLSGFPNVLTVHGNMRVVAKINGWRPFSYGWLAARLEGWALPRTDGVVCITRYTQAEVQPPARRTWVVPNPVDSTLFEINNVPASPPQILHIAHIQKRKNQIMLIRALDTLIHQIPFTVHFYGGVWPGDPYGEECLEMIRQRPWCEYHPFSDRPTIKAALSTAALLVLPSLEDNCPMTVLEAMAAGVPVMAAKVGGVPELIEDGLTGLFCDPNDPVSIRTAVHTVLSKPAFARELIARARRHANESFHPERIARRHVEIYREVLNSH